MTPDGAGPGRRTSRRTAGQTRSGGRRARRRTVVAGAALTVALAVAGTLQAEASSQRSRDEAAATAAASASGSATGGRHGRPTTRPTSTRPAGTPSTTGTPVSTPTTTSPSSPGTTSPGTTTTGPGGTGTGPGTSAPSGSLSLPPVNAAADYQLGGAYPPPAGVAIVSRDRSDSPAAGLYSICYVNAFQTQPDELAWWRGTHPDLLLKRNGAEVVDSDWGEVLLDTSTADKRAQLTAIVGGWIDGCAAKGFQAVEPDNLDSWTRSQGLLTQAEAVAFAGELATRAHADWLAIAQKNTSELGTAGRAAGFDFAVAEECAEYGECQSYMDVYGAHVIVIEYTRTSFDRACAQVGPSLSVVLRDVEVSPPGSAGYQFATC